MIGEIEMEFESNDAAILIYQQSEQLEVLKSFVERLTDRGLYPNIGEDTREMAQYALDRCKRIAYRTPL
jgi:hypothetical protein